ncbi:restriction endonuclease subunit S [Xanthomonas campestris pv. campestris]|uniref:restriction endonuclease subunit S n=1 Tax=Xanthomonas campestris TaxID=339 RepID=UPI0025A01D16|nr:restriction endonuclease subunit S [Xanthomonas campestris]MDM7679047.1 restriction endonuclease subunit S [Xanthomonas campestris pv. campestris]MDM7699966.1 restriction endonuclease subunit S [Xanthomonas campestris pv. campestris]MDM7721608.1 restriction endonuclease subunit S [Xanthomonas campestris pv. campestris]MEB1976387.1 restriction endonuclease subunit S [Xanthomonas campestris pv. campestris]MEB2009674.1 restriction endonuclease subunit S [Xanthomonas campestris pv. campestris]
MTAPRASVLPQGWTRRRLRFDCLSNPVKSKLDIPDDTEVSFVPMDAVGELGGLRLDQTRELADVYNGYTYFADGDVCIAKITPCFENGKGAIAEGLVNGVAFGTTELHVLRPSATLDTRFLFYLTIAHDFRSHGEAEMLGASGQKRVPEEFLKDWTPSLPRMDVQQRIARFLDEKTARIDALIEKKQALLNRLEEKRQALITRAVTKGLNPDVPMKPSGVDWLGEIPVHWHQCRLRFTVARIEQGWSPQCDSRPAGVGEWGVLKVGCVNGEKYNESENKVLPFDIDPLPHYEVKVGDVLVSRANTRELLGSAAIVDETQGKIMLCDKLYRVEVSEALDRNYLTAFLRLPLARFQYEREATGTSGSMQNIGQDTLKNLRHPMPPFSEQQEIAEWKMQVMQEFMKAEDIVLCTIAVLNEQRRAAITAAVTGQLPELNG